MNIRKFKYNYYNFIYQDKELEITTAFQGHFYELTSDLKIENRYDTSNEHKLDIKCKSGIQFCEEVTLLYQSKIDHPNYAFVVQFAKQAWPLSDTIDYIFEYVNPDYTGFLIALRYSCLFVSIVMCISYIRKLQRINSSHWVIEQKMIVLLSGLLILFNNPFYAITILIPNMASAFFEVLFIVNFFVVLLIFFLVVLDRIVRENGQKESRSLDKKKILFGVVLYFFLLLTYIGFSYNHLDDPYTSFQDSFGGFYEFCKWVGIVMLIGYFLSIMLFYINICKRYNSLIWRNRLFSLFSLYYIICCGIFAFSGSMDIYGSIGGRALLFITILNLYIYYMQYMYSFSPQGYQEAQQIINLEIGNRPQIYEVLDDSLHGIELASQNGDIVNNQKLNSNNNQVHQEHDLAQDIFHQHQMFNQMKQNDDRETVSQTSGKKSNYTPQYQQHDNHHEDDIENNNTPQKNSNQQHQLHKQQQNKNNNNQNNHHNKFDEESNQDENADQNQILNFEDEED